MLARRFTIVCLVVALFGMGLSMLVAEHSRMDTVRTQSIGCGGIGGLGCGLSMIR